MATNLYLAMRSEGFGFSEHFPAKSAWLDCCFSQTGPGLDGLPSTMPADSLLILTDRFPIQNHDPDLITKQLCQSLTALECAGVLLDFERREIPELKSLALRLVAALPCPVAVSAFYAGDLDCPVFLSPCPHHIPLSEHIAPGIGREIWLDLARDAEIITITPSGSVASCIPWSDTPTREYADKKLHCHYHMETNEECVRFLLRRTKDDLIELMQDAEALGIENCVGLYQEWMETQKPACRMQTGSEQKQRGIFN